jgi:hypothetical protein
MTQNDPYLLDVKVNKDAFRLSNESMEYEKDQNYFVSQVENALTGDPRIDNEMIRLAKLRQKRSKKEEELRQVTKKIQEFEYLVA